MWFLRPLSSVRRFRLLRMRSERGAVLVHTAIAMLGLTAFSTFVADYGMLWTARRQAQNSADAAALAAASSLGYFDINNTAAADAAAIAAATANRVWGQAPVITAADVNIVACPAGSFPNGVCVRADVYRHQDRGNPLPVWFGSVVGLSTQGVRATATAEVRFGRSAAECVKPLAIPDKWQEMQTPPWDLNDRFNPLLICNNGGNNCTPAVPPDVFIAPPAANHTGFVAARRRVDGTDGDLGREVIIKFGSGQSELEPGMYAPVRLGTSSGAADYRNNIEGCWNGTVSPGDQLGVEPGGKRGPTNQAFETIIARDSTAQWVTEAGGLGGGVSGGCEAAGTCGISPRIIPIILFNPTIWSNDPNGGPGAGQSNNCTQGDPTCNWNGPGSVTVTQIIGVFVERILNSQGGQIVGRLTRVPTLGLVGTGVDGDANIVNIVLVR